MYIIGSDLIPQFIKVSSNNRGQDGHHVETLAFLVGYFENDNYIATDLIFPSQLGQPHRVDGRGIHGEDSVPWAFQAFEDERNKKPCLIAWIHSHVQGAECCFSSIDNHTQYAYSKVHSGVLGLVIEIKPNGERGVSDFFEISKIGKVVIEACSRKEGCIASEQHESCSGRELYQSAAQKVIFDDYFSLTVKNFMSTQIEDNQSENNNDIEIPISVEEAGDNFSSQEPTNLMQCKNLVNCKTKAKKILMHLSKSKRCKELYSAEELAKLEELRNTDRKNYKRKRQRVYDEKNAETKRAKQQKYDQENAESKKTKQSQYNKKNAKKIAESQSQYNKKNAKKIAESQSQYNKINAKKIAGKQSQYDKKHAKKIVEKQSQYDKKNAKKIAEKQSLYNKKNASQIAEKQKARREIAKKNRTQVDRLQIFNSDIIEGPNFICFSCNRCLFKNGVKILKNQDIIKLLAKADRKFLKEIGLESYEDLSELILCHTCKTWFGKKKIPRIHVSNGLQLDDIPDELKLTDLEQQLIARTLIFLKVKKLPKSGMKSNIDQVISVPIECDDVSKTVSQLPWHPDDASIVAVQLKRRLHVKNSHLSQYIRPKVVLKALQALKAIGNPFYQDIDINEDFLNKQNVFEDPIETVETESQRLENELDEEFEREQKKTREKCIAEKDQEIPNEKEPSTNKSNVEEIDTDDENETRLKTVKNFQSVQNNITCLYPRDMSNNVIMNSGKSTIKKVCQEGKESIKIAPGEGKVASVTLREEHTDVKAFPRHHLSGKFGLNYQRKFKIYPQMYFSQRLLNQDERFSKDPSYLFMASYYVERLSVERQINISGLKGKSETGEDGKTTMHLRDMFDVFKRIKGTPKYWQHSRNELVAKVKQLGPFHLFYTFSCGEMRWPEIFLSIFKRKGYDISYPENWTGEDQDLLVEGMPLWEYVNKEMPCSTHELFKDYNFLITRIFDERVKSFVQNILMGNGKNQVPLRYYSYRVEFQARGMPHIHGVDWIDNDYLVNGCGIKGFLSNKDCGDAVAQLADKLISCKFPAEDQTVEKSMHGKPSLRQIVEEVQVHGHTNSCLKYNGACRYKFPRLPSQYTVVARPIDERIEKGELHSMTKEEKQEFMGKAKKIFEKAKEILAKVDLGEEDKNMGFEEFCKKAGTNRGEYMKFIKTTEKGTVLILERDVIERNVNNFSPEMLNAWNANMDIQIALDPFAIITYIVNYVNKDETGMTKFMTEALHGKQHEEAKEKLKALKFTYFTHRQVGASEACYRINSGMNLKDSNIACTFVASGFPENRSVFYRKVVDDSHDEVQEPKNENYTENSQEDSEDDFEDDFEDNSVDPLDVVEEVERDSTTHEGQETVKIKDREGEFAPAVTIHDRYAARPKYLKDMCLAQFAISYTYISKTPKRCVFETSETELGISTLRSFRKICGSETCLPNYISLTDNLGFMRLRNYPLVLRIHDSKKKDGDEQEYSELLLFSAWRDEEQDIARDNIVNCFNEKRDEIEKNREAIYPGDSTIGTFDTVELDLMRPTHVADTLDGQGEQENNDDLEEGSIDDPAFASFAFTGNVNQEVPVGQRENNRFKKIVMPNDQELKYLTRRLVPEQMNVLRPVIASCKAFVKARNNHKVKVKPARLIVNGGAGVGKSATIKATAFHAERILKKEGQNTGSPRVLLCAHTGKAANLIGGQTICSAFGFKFDKYSAEYLSDKRKAQMQTDLAELKLIIIDEISMVGADMLYKIHMRLTEIFKTPVTVPFGGISIILVGDLLQLPPVRGTCVFSTPEMSQFKGLADAKPLWDEFKPMILKHNHRQGKDKEWANSLNRFREGIVWEEDKKVLESRVISDEDPKLMDDKTMHIFYYNDDVNDHNEKMLKLLPGNMIEIKAEQKLPPGCKSLLNRKKGTIGQTNFHETLKFKIGAKCMLVFNIDLMDGLFNGANGTIIALHHQNGKLDSIIVKFDDDVCGIDQRLRYPMLTEKYRNQNGTAIKRYALEHQITKTSGWRGAAKAKLVQFPLRINYAQTSHKMQGETVPAGSKVIIHWLKGMQRGMAYVMLGRCERLEDLSIAGKLDFSQIKCDPIALKESKRLESNFDLAEKEEIREKMNYWKICYLNVRSMKASNGHAEDVAKDNIIMDSDMFGLGETWLEQDQKRGFEGFSGYFANFGRGKGVAGYSKIELVSPPEKFESESYSAIKFKTPQFCIIFLYLSKTYNKEDLSILLDMWIEANVPCAVIGDINENLMKLTKSTKFEKMMREKGFQQLIKEPTCETGSIIDHIYINPAMATKNVVTHLDAAYYSDHDILSLYIPKC